MQGVNHAPSHACTLHTNLVQAMAASKLDRLRDWVREWLCSIVSWSCTVRVACSTTRDLHSHSLPPLQAAFFLLGTINNLPYVVVNSSALILASRSGRACM